MRATVPLTRRRKAAKQVDSAGYKGDDEKDDYRMSVRRVAEASDRPPTGVTGDAKVEAFVAAYMSKDDLVFIQTLSKGMRRKKKPIQTPGTASRGRTGISVTFGACRSSENSACTPDSVGDAQNMGGTHRPSDALSSNPISSKNARDQNPTYNQDTLNPNTCNSNPMYPQSTPMHGSNVPPKPAFDSGGDKPCISTSSRNARDADEDTQRCTSQPDAGFGDLTCQPYAVRYQEEEDAVDITPYAVAYMGQRDTDSNEQTDTSTPSSSSCNDSNASVFDNTLQAPAQYWLSPNPMYPQNALNPNPMYVQNTGNPNPLVPNARQDSDCVCASRWVCTALTIAIVLVLLIVGGAFVGMYINTSEHDSQKPTKAMDSDHTPGHPDVDSPSTPGQPAVDSPSTPGQPDRCISERVRTVNLLSISTIRYTGGQTTTIASTKTQGTVPPPTSNSSQESYVNSKPIVLGGEGTSALLGNLSDPSGVAVSDDEEIFVVEVLNRRVQVFNLNGVSLRVFRTVVPGRDDLVMYPTDVDIDKDGRIWVVGKFSFPSGAVRVVQYSKDGLPVATFDVPRKDWFPKIAMNARDNSIIVVASNEILMFKPNGSFDGSFGGKEGAQL
uniref:SMP-30/Gluconolactonase/LRE-like region domain-containing protein n=1 Tax=Branchiostoma floridae TaxID=7739 RepID=C3YAV0_BRAFL|eukprot:XP_002606541.1 hypothetical protein BRAFLDRAFT_102543 [Branchiostoma floridae]